MSFDETNLEEKDSRFVEQAEYIPRSDFIEWSSTHPQESEILNKLTRTGAKLLTGPRGCGKTTLMLKAYNNLITNKRKSTVPVYVNFKASLRLEPIYKIKANGAYWFSQWMYLKILEGLHATLQDLKLTSEDILTRSKKDVEKVIASLELGQLNDISKSDFQLSVYDLVEELEKVMDIAKRTRCVLLLDDAAHAFSPEQQRDFFEFFRKIKSRTISPKAAIYPGVTNFAPTFNIGHDADEVDAWVNPESPEYLRFMLSMLERRLPKEVFSKLKKDEPLLSILCYSAFGIPRILLNMVRNVYTETAVNEQIKYNINFKRNKVLKLVKENYQRTLEVYNSLQIKYPNFKNYVEEGQGVLSKLVELIKEYNRDKSLEKKSITIAIKKDMSSDLKRIMGFFQYAGLVSYKSPLSKGEKGTFELYVINLAALIDGNAIIVTSSVSASDLSKSLETRNAHSYTRTQTDKLLKPEKGDIKLSMPPCQNCGVERLSIDSKFCSECGSELQATSIYAKLIQQDLSVLPLTNKRIETIKSKSSIKTIKDILHDIGHRELKSVPQIAEYWAHRIYYAAEEYIS